MLIVTVARTELKLVSVDALKTELQITTADTDDYLSGVLDRTSEAVEAYCKRIFAVETVQETYRPSSAEWCLLLTRYPVIAISSITEDAVAVAASDYEVDNETGELFRLTSDMRDRWWALKIVVTYQAGYTSLPGPVTQAIFELVKLGQAARTRDPSLRSENILEGLYSYTLFGSGDYKAGMPSTVAAMLDPYVAPVQA